MDKTALQCLHCYCHSTRLQRILVATAGLVVAVAVVIAFFICWAPFHVQRLIAIYGTGNDHITSKSKWMEFLYYLFTYVSGVLYYVSTTINPILYNIMSHKFREAFMETLARSCGSSSSSTQQEQRSYSSLSRSQQKAAGIFGSRTVGTGSALAQESSECSCNSLKEESPQQSTTAYQSEIVATVDSSEASQPSQVDFPSQSTRPSAPSNTRNNVPEGDTSLTEGLNSTALVQTTGDKVTPSRWDSKKSKTNCNSTEKQNGRVCVHVKKTTQTRGKKWWRFFKWLPGPKAFKFNPTSGNFGDGIADIESNREEYSMTTCYVTGEHRFV